VEQSFGESDCLFGVGACIIGNQLNLFAVDAASSVDFGCVVLERFELRVTEK